MRKILAMAGVLCLTASGALAATGSSFQKVATTIDPVVGFATASTTGAATGDIFGADGLVIRATFTPHANTQYVDMSVCATDLYKGDWPGSIYKIPLDLEVPAVLSGVGFSPTPQDMPLLAGQPDVKFDAYTWPVFCSNNVRFHSGNNNAFSHTVDVDVDWNGMLSLEKTELPQGGYSGYVKLIVATVP